MRFKQKEDYIDLLQPIEEVKPLLKKHYNEKGRMVEITEHSMLHYRYVLTLEQITPKSKFPEKPTTLRVIESDISGHVAIHEVSLDRKKPKLLGTYLSEASISNFKHAIARMEEDFEEGEIRLLSVPALNIEAVWVHYEDSRDDKIAITVKFIADDEQIFTQEQFLGLLNQRKKKLGKIKGKMGG